MHASSSFAWNARSFPRPADYTVDVDSDLARAYEEVKSGRGFVVVSGLPVGGTLDEFIDAVLEVGDCFGERLSQNAQGERVGHVIDATNDDPTPRMYRSNLELRPHSDITAMISLACWQKARSGGESVIVSGVTVHDEIARRAPQHLEPLYRGYHYHRLGEESPGEEPATPYRVPVFSLIDDQLSVRYQRTGIAAGHRELGVPITDEDVAAFNLFDELAKAPENRLSFFLERGEMIVINNYTVMHARTEFRNFPEPERQRRLIRLWLDREGFRDVPKEYRLFPASNGVPPQPGKRANFDFRKLYAVDPVATGGIPKL